MSLTKDDLKQINSLLIKRLDDQRDKLVSFIKSQDEMIIIRLEKLESRLSILKTDNSREHQEIKDKLEDLKDMETEDFQVLVEDVEKLEKRVAKLEARTV